MTKDERIGWLAGFSTYALRCVFEAAGWVNWNPRWSSARRSGVIVTW